MGGRCLVTIDKELESGRLPNVDAVLWVRESTIAAGPAAGTRAIDIRPWGGIGCRIYPDRGLDIGQAWLAGVPLAWVSRVGEAAPLAELDGMAWGDAFSGGLLTTCGLRNVGMPSEGHGLHGTYSHLAAHDVTVSRHAGVDGAAVTVTGTVTDTGGPEFVVHRTIRVHAGVGRIELEDVTLNKGDVAEAAPLLYHFNFGYPLWAPPAQLDIPAVTTVARDPESEVALDSWHDPPDIERAPERVLEHDLGDLAEGWARIGNDALGVSVELRWDRTTLPRLNQWLDPNPGMAVLGVEPANCSTRGRAADRKAGILPTLAAGGKRITRLVLEVSVARGV
jgi:hypothetical protein